MHWRKVSKGYFQLTFCLSGSNFVERLREISPWLHFKLQFRITIILTHILPVGLHLFITYWRSLLTSSLHSGTHCSYSSVTLQDLRSALSPTLSVSFRIFSLPPTINAGVVRGFIIGHLPLSFYILFLGTHTGLVFSTPHDATASIVHC